MATVYRGRDPDLARDVAVKVLHPHLCSREESRLRFRREARAVARLKHPSVLEVYEAGEDEGRPFIVSELIRGGSLDAWATARRPVPPEVVAAIGLRVAEGLHAAHQAGIIHRDLKPGNILMGAGGQVKVADFGIAQIVDIEHLTSTGQILGSPAFMSPEHLEGARLDARADVFSFGTLLYWMSTAELPFNGPNPHAVLRRVLESDFPDPARVRPEIGEYLADVIRTCLQRRPEDRYASMADLASALRSVLAVAGATNLDDMVVAFEREPELERRAILRRREAALIDRCHQLTRTKGAEAEVRRLCSWILAWEPDHREALRLVEETMQRGPAARLALAAGVVAALAAVLVLWLVLRGGPGTSTDAGPLDAVAGLPADAPETITRRADAGTSTLPTAVALDSFLRVDAATRDAEAQAEARDVAAAETAANAADGPPDVPETLADAPAENGLRDALDAATEVTHPPVPPVRPPRTVAFRPAPCQNVEIWVDGERLGVYGPPPGVLSTTLPLGEHLFAYKPLTVNCYPEEWRESVPAGSGSFALSHRLRLRPAQLLVDTAGAEATVDVFGRASGRANEPIEVPFEPQDGLSPMMRVVVTFPGHPPVRRDVQVRAGESVTVQVPPPVEQQASADAG
jgi:serine/threonine-protein kinase